ncbi:hypothetical protein EX30DRAFT_398354 [Ascodesmis nigricans]|uniref:Uncharacterized protein n=1 Tax=Ascodesmis nigricans TaxID=341454 RepID=A0A4S2MKW3_9PEZI|nr:hypothetical protein EX30DRAFT_398354 [Ascodesmis nigricans]
MRARLPPLVILAACLVSGLPSAEPAQMAPEDDQSPEPSEFFTSGLNRFFQSSTPAGPNGLATPGYFFNLLRPKSTSLVNVEPNDLDMPPPNDITVRPNPNDASTFMVNYPRIDVDWSEREKSIGLVDLAEQHAAMVDPESGPKSTNNETNVDSKKNDADVTPLARTKSAERQTRTTSHLVLIPPAFEYAYDDEPERVWVSCIDHSKMLYRDFKVTWGPAIDDDETCQALRKLINKRGLTTGWRCSQEYNAEKQIYQMAATGHRPQGPKGILSGAIREVFKGKAISYANSDSTFLCG